MSGHPAFMDLLGAVSPGAAAIAQPNPENPHIGLSLVPGVALGVGGFLVGKHYGHPVLGFLLAEAAGLNAARLIRNHPGDRTIAFTNLATSLTAVAGSLLLGGGKDAEGKPQSGSFGGWWLGLAVGLIVTAFVPGSNASKLRQYV